jgi:hypothetical protein
MKVFPSRWNQTFQQAEIARRCVLILSPGVPEELRNQQRGGSR